MEPFCVPIGISKSSSGTVTVALSDFTTCMIRYVCRLIIIAPKIFLLCHFSQIRRSSCWVLAMTADKRGNLFPLSNHANSYLSAQNISPSLGDLKCVFDALLPIHSREFDLIVSATTPKFRRVNFGHPEFPLLKMQCRASPESAVGALERHHHHFPEVGNLREQHTRLPLHHQRNLGQPSTTSLYVT